MAALHGTLVLTFAEPEIEAAYQRHRTAALLRAGELTSRGAFVVSMLLFLAGSTGGGSLAAFQRANAVCDLVLFGLLGLAFSRDAVRASLWYSGVLAVGLLHFVAVCSIEPSRAARFLRLEKVKGHSGLWTEASAGVVITGLLMSVVLFSGLSLRETLILMHAVVFLYYVMCLEPGPLESDHLEAVCDALSRSSACLFRAACLYGFAVFAFAMRHSREAEERHGFATQWCAAAGALRGGCPGGAPPEAQKSVLARSEPKAKPGLEPKAKVEATRVEAKAPAGGAGAGGGAGGRAGAKRAEGPSPKRREPKDVDMSHSEGKLDPKGTGKRVLTVPHPPPRARDRERGASDDYGPSTGPNAPNARLVAALRGKTADWERIRMMAAMIRKPGYGLRAFFDDCITCFPELQLFFHEESERSGKSASSGVSNEAEYQRTIGALFAVYWLLRLHVDGRLCFCYGVDAKWEPCKPKRVGNNPLSFRRVRSADANPAPLAAPPQCFETESDTSCATKSTVHLEQGMAFQMMTEAQKRASFFETMQWSMFEDLITQAGCQMFVPGSQERTMALLCLTAFHDLMKVEALLPVVQPEHAPYLGYDAGVVIRDHDVALSYVLEHFPNLLPSFAGLPANAQRAVLFTQGKMNFNHGWFVQAEAPPGAMLSTLKSVLMAGATAADLGLYFLHWFTDLAGAEATPLGGAEKFVLKFPHAVLASFLWSIPFLGKLEAMSETAVIEQYLKARWRVLLPDVPCPQDGAAIACMRLAIMAQSDESVVDAFRSLPARDRHCLAIEMARTGCVEQKFSTGPGHGAGPAFLMYYGPALLQKNVDSPRGLRASLRVLAEVTRVARALWPLRREEEGLVVTVAVAELKTQSIDEVVGTSTGSRPRGRWVLVRHNDREGAVEFIKDTLPSRREDHKITLYEVLTFDHVFHDETPEELDTSEDVTGVLSEDEDQDVAKPLMIAAPSASSGEANMEKRGSRRASQLPFAAEDEDCVESTVESGLAANLRQENWLLRDQISTLGEEVARLRARLAGGSVDLTDSTACGTTCTATASSLTAE